MRSALRPVILSIGILALFLTSGCSWGRYPCPPGIEVSNSEKDGSGVELVKVEKKTNGLVKKKHPKRIRKK